MGGSLKLTLIQGQGHFSLSHLTLGTSRDGAGKFGGFFFVVAEQPVNPKYPKFLNILNFAGILV